MTLKAGIAIRCDERDCPMTHFYIGTDVSQARHEASQAGWTEIMGMHRCRDHSLMHAKRN